MSFDSVLRENLGATLGVALGAFTVLVACIVISCLAIYCCWKRCRRRSYRRLRSPNSRPQSVVTSLSVSRQQQQATRVGQAEEGLYEAMQRQRIEQETTRRETGLLNCQFYLRSNQKYVMETHLPEIGSRISKNWFMIRPIGTAQSSSPILLTMLPISAQCRVSLHGSDKHIINKLLKAIEHPSIHKITSVDYIPDKRIVVIMEPFLQRGSLKDRIYQTTPSLSWSTKYSVRRSGLRVHHIQNYGRQILEAIMFLHDLGLKPLGQIQSGNIYIEGSRCKLSGIDNFLLGYKPRIFRHIKQHGDDIDSVMFGHLLFELASGRELSTSPPNEDDYRYISQQVADVLRFIFQSRIPSIVEILQHSFFQNAKTSDLDHWSYEGVRLDEDMNDLIYRAKKGKTRTAKRRSSSRPSSFSSVTPDSPFSPYGIVAASSPKTPKTSTFQFPASTAGATATAAPDTATTDRSALLSDIHKGKSLRHTVTDDRSAPKIK